MDGSNLPRYIVDRFERRWAKKLNAQTPASKLLKPGGPVDRVGPNVPLRTRPNSGKGYSPGNAIPLSSLQSPAAEPAIARFTSALDEFG
jgi:hypothetical protein